MKSTVVNTRREFENQLRLELNHVDLSWTESEATMNKWLGQAAASAWSEFGSRPDFTIDNFFTAVKDFSKGPMHRFLELYRTKNRYYVRIDLDEVYLHMVSYRDVDAQILKKISEHKDSHISTETAALAKDRLILMELAAKNPERESLSIAKR